MVFTDRRVGQTDAPTLFARHLPSRPHRRGGVVRKRRWESRPPVRTHLYINAMSAAPITDWSLTDGAYRLLCLIVQKSGGPGVPEFALESLATFTRSLASLLGRDPKTTRNHLGELEAAGYLTRWVCRETNRVHIRLSERLHGRPGASAVPEERKIRVPATWARPQQGRKPGAWQGGKIFSAIDPSPNCNPLSAEAERNRNDRLVWSDEAMAKRQRYSPPTRERVGLWEAGERAKATVAKGKPPPPAPAAPGPAVQRALEEVPPEPGYVAPSGATRTAIEIGYNILLARLEAGAPLQTVLAVGRLCQPPESVARLLRHLNRGY